MRKRFKRTSRGFAAACRARAKMPARAPPMIEITAGVVDDPPALQAAVDQDPMTGRGWTPAIRRAALSLE
ncbi:hypothetical protein [Bradyrhizobium quebecense]|uniref:Uncharacterized protein n=2 Tax=Bradyrhizobium quebecense TaxID=2748629 RepID=A0ABS3MKS1_9BRAD|nr:hypothetical protein [Bradyrhizobium quebecense]UGX99980.1 hypothetical protein J4P68_0021915 [Bradyrhizobium quebecense]